MKKVVAIGALLAMVATACGGVTYESAETTATVGGDELSQDDSPSSSSSAQEPTATADSLGDTLPKGDEQALEVELVDPASGQYKSSQPTPALPAEDGTVSPPIVDHSDPHVAAAIADLVDRLGVGVASVEVVSNEAVTWRDGSLGCPQPGMSYTQALVSGRRVVLAYSEFTYSYHSSRTGEPFYCATPTEPSDSGALPPIDH